MVSNRGVVGVCRDRHLHALGKVWLDWSGRISGGTVLSDVYCAKQYFPLVHSVVNRKACYSIEF